jgi:hypothetical protein
MHTDPISYSGRFISLCFIITLFLYCKNFLTLLHNAKHLLLLISWFHSSIFFPPLFHHVKISFNLIRNINQDVELSCWKTSRFSTFMNLLQHCIVTWIPYDSFLQLKNAIMQHVLFCFLWASAKKSWIANSLMHENNQPFWGFFIHIRFDVWNGNGERSWVLQTRVNLYIFF